VTRAPGEVLVVADGEIDLCTGPGLQSFLTHALDHPSCRTLIVDLRRVHFVGARGVGVLATTSKLALEHDVRVAVVANHRPVLRLLHVTAGSPDVATFPTLASGRTPPSPPPPAAT